MPFTLQLAWFQHYYPHAYRRDDYPTADRVIPYKLFWLMYSASTANMTLERLNMGQAVVFGANVAMAGDTPQVKRLSQRWQNEAHGQF